MQKDKHKSLNELNKERKEIHKIACEKVKTKDIKKLKTLEEIMKEKP